MRAYHISPDGCGAERLVQIVRRNGLRGVCDTTGTIAHRVVTAAMTGRAPFRHHGAVRLYTGLWRLAPLARPPLEAWRLFGHLRRHDPQARFILTTRDPEAWVLDRATRDGGAVLTAYARHWNLPEERVIERWRGDWDDHLAAVAAHFGDDPALIRIDCDRDSPQDAARRLRALWPLPTLPVGAGWWRADPAPTSAQLARLDRLTGEAAPDPDFAADVARFCLGNLAPDDSGKTGVSRLYCRWDGGRLIRDGRNNVLPVTIGPAPDGRGDLAAGAPDMDFKEARAEGVVNQILQLGRRDPVRIDMQDSRWMGSPDGPPLGVPVLGHNRRSGARNLVLWPLPGQHEIGLRGYATAVCDDPIPFADKIDRIVWRGHISGAETLPGRIRPGMAAHDLLALLHDAAPSEAPAIVERLNTVPRLAFLRRWHGHADVDAGMVLAPRYRHMAAHPALAPYGAAPQGRAFFRRFRYQLCLAGYDHGSNFLGAINTRGVLFKEEDGWEVFYLGRFRAWEHYIPVARHLDDLPERLAWARDHPQECRAMSRAARAEVARFANHASRDLMLRLILDGLARVPTGAP